MTDSDIVKRLQRIDAYQNKISDIRLSDHPRANEIADALYEQCWFPASAEHVAVEYLNLERWALRVYDSGMLGEIVSRAQARKKGFQVLSKT